MSQARTNTLTIVTPEGIAFSLLLAGPVTRFLAWLIDMAAISAMAGAASQLVSIFGLLSTDIAGALVILMYFIISIGYGILLEWHWRGQTLGKRVLGLRVMDAQGLPLQFSQVVIRNLLRFIDSLPAFYLVGGTACLASARYQRLGDLAGNTIVTRSPQIPEPDLTQLLADKYNSFRGHPHLEARLRQQATPREAGAALEALIRRDQLDPRARTELFRDIAAHFMAMVKFPRDITEGISDEQIVRNVVDALFREQLSEK